MRKILLGILALFLLYPAVSAQQLSQQEAQQVASTFMSSGKAVNGKENLKWVYSGGSPINPDYFVFNANQGNGFVIVAADRRAPDPIFAYSFTGNFDAKQIPDPSKVILDSYSELIQTIRLKGGNDRKTALRSAVSPALRATTQVGPLLGGIAWHQKSPFYNQCPIINGKQSITGCGATATGQLMRYHKWPLQGTGSYKGKGDGGSLIDYSAATYNWDLILETYGPSATPEQVNEVAKLMYHVGNAEDMNYGPDSGTSAENIAAALVRNFGYADKIQRAYRVSYTDEEWFNLIKREIDLGRPIIYSGSSTLYGHLFVCDGYDSNGKLHMNFGWNGYLNAFYSLKDIDFVYYNRILTGIYPANQTVPEADQGLPQVTMVTPLNSSSYSMKTGTKFNIGSRVANYSHKHTYNNVLGIALFKDGIQVGEPLAQTSTLAIGVSDPISSASEGISETNILIKDVVIPTGIANGTYQLRLMAKQGSKWIPALAVPDYVVKELNVLINQGQAELSYPSSNNVLDLELESPIEVNMALNQATVKFTVRNVESDYDVDSTNIYVMANTDNQLVPTVWKSVRVEKLLSGQTRTFEISDIPMPANSTQCRFYVAYNRAKILPIKEYEEVAATPMMPAGSNFYNYTLQKEIVNTEINFDKTDIPSTFKKYKKDGTTDTRNWDYGKLAVLFDNNRLVTHAIKVTEYSVLEWECGNRHGGTMDYRVAVSTEGQDFHNFDTPIYDKRFPYTDKTKSNGVARLSLSEYAGNDIYISFSNSENGEYGLLYFKILEIVSPKDISAEGLNLPGTAIVGQSVPVKVQVKNCSAINVKKVKASYTYLGTTVSEDFNTDISFNEIKELVFTTPISIRGTSGDALEVKVKIEQEGELTEQLANNETSTKILVADFFAKKNLLIFKASKLLCPGCMQAYNKLSEIEEAFPGVVFPLELWRAGVLYSGDEYKNYTMGTTPTYSIDGKAVSNGDAVYNIIADSYSTMSAPASVAVDANYENAESRKLKIKVKSTFALPLRNSTYHLGAVIIENNVIDADKQTAGSRPADSLLRKDHIVVKVIGGVNGATGKEIKNPEAKEYVYEFDFDVPAVSQDAYKRKLDKGNIQVIGVLYDGQGNIVNSAIDCYYLKFPKTSGLTFKAQDNAPEFRHLYELESLTGFNLGSVETYRAILPTKGTFRFKIEKDASLIGKTVKLIVNKGDRLRGLDAEDELLLPDADSVYTITDAQKHYIMTIGIEDEVEFPAKVTKNGTEWKLSGTWKSNDFTTVLKTVDTGVTSIDMTTIVIPVDVPALNVSNPNTLIYTIANATVPASWKNVVKGKVAGAITLKEGYSFCSTRSFTATSVAFECNYPAGVNTVSLPFALAQLPEGVVAERLDSISRDTVSFVPVKSMLANTPYLLTVKGTAVRNLSVSNVLIEQSIEKPATPAPNYTFRYTYSGITSLKDRKLFTLNAPDSTFEKVSGTPAISSFQAYFEYEGTATSYQTLKIAYLSRAVIEADSSGSVALDGKWNKEDFKEKLGEIEEKVTELDMSAIEIPEDVDSLKVSNPNTLIFVSEETKIPEVWKNYNIVQGNNTKSINLIQGKPFNANKQFDADTALFKGSYQKGFNTICLPYDLDKLPSGVKAEEFVGYKNGKLEFKEVLTLHANTPYLLSMNVAASDMEFKALHAVIKQTKTTDSDIISGDYAFKYTYATLTGTEMGNRKIFVPTVDGKEFAPLTAPITRAVDAEIPAFCAYIEYVGTGVPSLDIEHSKDVVNPDPDPNPNPGPTPGPTPDPELPTGIDKVLSPETFELFVKDQVVTILSGKERTVYMIDLNGRISRTLKLVTGTNKIYGVESGIYIIEKHKLIVN